MSALITFDRLCSWLLHKEMKTAIKRIFWHPNCRCLSHNVMFWLCEWWSRWRSKYNHLCLNSHRGKDGIVKAYCSQFRLWRQEVKGIRNKCSQNSLRDEGLLFYRRYYFNFKSIFWSTEPKQQKYMLLSQCSQPALYKTTAPVIIVELNWLLCANASK